MVPSAQGLPVCVEAPGQLGRAVAAVGVLGDALLRRVARREASLVRVSVRVRVRVRIRVRLA